MWVYWVIGVLLFIILIMYLIIGSKAQELKSQKEQHQNSEAEFNKGISQLHYALAKTYGYHYLYEISEAPNGVYLDQDLLPHSHQSNFDRYTFYCSRSKFHEQTCRYAKMGFPENAHRILNSWKYSRCTVCHSQLPDMKWVDEYRKHFNFLKQHTNIKHIDSVSPKYQDEIRQKQQIAEDLNRILLQGAELDQRKKRLTLEYQAHQDKMHADREKNADMIISENKAHQTRMENERIQHKEKIEAEYKEHLRALAIDRHTHKQKLLLELKNHKARISSELKEHEEYIDKLRAEKENLTNFIEKTKSNLDAIPYLAGIIADYETHGISILAEKLDWGSNQERAKKVISIRQIRKEASDAIAKSKEAQYQLEYAIRMFPGLEDFLETDYRELHKMDLSDISDEMHDRTRNYLSKEEYSALPSTERNQLALDRYRTSHSKTNWQIGRDYEYYIGYLYTKKGYDVEYFGSENGLEDLGRDLIATKDGRVLIIQCKYWSSKKQIHEKHINQLYGTMISYCFENDLPTHRVRGVLVTNISLSDTAKRFAKYLGIEVIENLPLGEYPCIKCNINKDEYSIETKIYHLPFDQQYDTCKIDRPGEFFALTVAEAEAAGFRRAFRWHDK